MVFGIRSVANMNFTPQCIDYTRVLHHWYISQKKMTEWSSLLSVRLLFGLIYSSIFVFGVLGNGSVVYVLIKNRRLTARNFFLVNLMLADLLLCFTAVPITPVVIVWKEWYLGGFMCRFVPLAQSVSVMLISWSLAAIAFDKYIHIMDVTTRPVSSNQASLFLIVSWVAASVVNLPYMLSYRLMAGKDAVGPGEIPFCGHFCTERWWGKDYFKKLYGTLVLCVQFAVPMVMISFCYVRILCIVQRDLIVKNRDFSTSLSRRQQEDALRVQRRVTFILVAMVLAFLMAWFPLTLMNILRDYATVPKFVKVQVYFWGLTAHSMAVTTVIWNPVLCFWLTCKVKQKEATTNTTASTKRDTHKALQEALIQNDKNIEMQPMIEQKLAYSNGLKCSEKDRNLDDSMQVDPFMPCAV